MARAFVFVLDSFGIGGAPDAAAFGDEGSDTFGHIEEECANGRGDRPGLRSGPLNLPHMRALGLGPERAETIAAIDLTIPAFAEDSLIARAQARHDAYRKKEA